MKILANNWKTIALKAKTMYLAYTGVLFGVAMQFPDLAVHLQTVADALGQSAKGARTIAIASAVAAVLRVYYQKGLSRE